MTLIVGKELHDLIDQGVITAEHDNVNASSIDVRLGNRFMEEYQPVCFGSFTIDPREKNSSHFREVITDSYELESDGFILAQTMEVFNLPLDITAHLFLKSSTARAGLNHNMAAFCDPGWHGSVLTLELKNYNRYHSILLTAGMKVAQIVFHRHAPVDVDMSYAVRGQYNNDLSVSASKGAK